MTDDYLRCEDVTFFVELLSPKLRKAMVYTHFGCIDISPLLYHDTAIYVLHDTVD